MNSDTTSRVEQFNQLVRGAVTAALCGAFIYGFIVTKQVNGEVFSSTFAIVMGFWFAARQAARDDKRNGDAHPVVPTTPTTERGA